MQEQELTNFNKLINVI